MSDFTTQDSQADHHQENINARVAELLAEGSQDIYRLVIEPIEREVVRNVVAHCKGNYVRASRMLGISRMTLRKKLGVVRPWGKRRQLGMDSGKNGADDAMNPVPKHGGRGPMERVETRSNMGVVPFDLA
jgi:DNA-binding protein Fis